MTNMCPASNWCTYVCIYRHTCTWWTAFEICICISNTSFASAHKVFFKAKVFFIWYFKYQTQEYQLNSILYCKYFVYHPNQPKLLGSGHQLVCPCPMQNGAHKDNIKTWFLSTIIFQILSLQKNDFYNFFISFASRYIPTRGTKTGLQ